MSYHCWTVDGYGVAMENYPVASVDRVWNLIKLDPEFESFLCEKLAQYDEDDADNNLDNICTEAEDYSPYYRPGVAGLLAQVIEDCEGITLEAAEDFDCDTYLLLMPHYSWTKISDKEKNLTKKELADLFQKYISIISDAPIAETSLDYYSVENGG